MFTQSACLLTSRPLTLDDLAPALAGFEVLGRTERQDDAHWAIGAPAWVLALPGHARGRIIVDALAERWPDTMGRPDDTTLTHAWAMGAFGPGVSPGCLERAGQQAWAWRKAGDAVRGHQGFIRIRLAYAPEKDEDAVPSDRDPKAELLAVTRVAAKLLEVDGVRCYFNPNGESLRSGGFVWQAMDYLDAEGELPLDVWANVRVGKLDAEGAWMLMDGVGLGQLGLPDVELVFPAGRAPLEAADRYLRDVMAYLADAGDVISEGDKTDGPDDGAWIAHRVEEGFSPPTRATIRLIPAGVEPPPRLLMTGTRAAKMLLDAAQAQLDAEIAAQADGEG
ncbi:MAG: DUF4261 domain-containing protein [Myxococcales bacterium]|nr:DUF4261 domain-containing protein [Myxococcales bacterium]MCB9544253.1 DUF4261 domain-containing protein [Myxococcales bacterium]